MANIRSVNEIILSMLDFLRTSIPELTINEGSVSKDLFVNLPATQLSLLYDELSKISNLQSLRVVSGSDLDRLAANFGAKRKTSAKASGIGLLTFSALPATVNINKNDLITATNGSTFAVINGISVNPASSNLYRSIATKFRNDLDFLGVSDTFAAEVSVQATTPGIAGNISKYSLVKTNIPGVSNVSNVLSFTGGSNQEDDTTFRNRVLAIFSGSNVGTALGYKNIVLADSSVLDALIVEPGDPLMVRDGTIVSQNTDGSFNIISEGTGGKVDIIILGFRLSEFVDSFVYRDLSNTNDPTNSKNNFVLGQIPGDENKTITRKRIDNIKNNTIPAQPVEEILEVSGSGSGSNFIVKTSDSFGRISGNYELFKDTGSYAGSPWGFDTFKWISNKISFDEDRVKSKFAGQDNLTFTDVLQIPLIQQNINVANENSTINGSDRSIIKLLHSPATNITRVFNVNTGERYIIADQNLDGGGSINTTGRIKISGNTLPATSDVLQVDYIWILDYDAYNDFDGIFLKNNKKSLNNNPRQVSDSIDWGLSNAIKKEKIILNKNITSTFYTGSVSHIISSVIAVNICSIIDYIVSIVDTGIFTGRKSINLINLPSEIENIYSIQLKNSNQEIYNTIENDGTFINSRVIIDSEVRWNSTIILPTDTSAEVDNYVNIKYDSSDIFNIENSFGNFSSNQITIPSDNFINSTEQVIVYVDYIANIQDVLSTTINNLPLSRFGNSFISNNLGFINNFINNNIIKEYQQVQKNTSDQYFINLDILVSDYMLQNIDIISIINLSNSKEYWNADHLGTVSSSSANKYQLILDGLNSPSVGDNVLIVYTVKDVKKTQPFTYENEVFKYCINTLQYDFNTNKFYSDIQNFISQSSIALSIIDASTNEILATASDGVLTSGLENSSTATLTSSSINFSDIDNIISKKVKISNSTNINNNGIFDIFDFNSSGNIISINNNINEIINNQISIIKISDGKDLWDDSGLIDIDNNKLYISSSINNISVGDSVLILYTNFHNLKQSPSKLSITVSDQINNSGIITIYGDTIIKVEDIIFTATINDLKQNVLEAIKKFNNSLSASILSSNIYLSRVVKLEKVSLVADNEIDSVLYTYDTLGVKIKNNELYTEELINDKNLNNFEFIIPSTTGNIENEPKIGDNLRITFYYSVKNDSENINFTKNGTLYTNKTFSFIKKIYISSGFSSSQSSRILISFLNQPSTGSRYKAFYEYKAPKENERITIRYNFNKLIGDSTFNLETQRPINADVLIKSADKLLVNTTINIVIKNDFLNSEPIVLQNVRDAIINRINTNILEDNLNSSDLITTAQSVSGVERSRVLFFNKDGNDGQVLTLTCQKNQYFVANNIAINLETI